MPPIQVSPDQFAVVLDGMLKADGPWRVRALPCPATQAVQVGPEVPFELPRDPAAASVGNRPVQQTRVVGLLPRVEQLARLNSWLDRTCDNVMGRGPHSHRAGAVDEPRSEDDRDDEQDLNSDPTGHRQRDHPGYALTLRSRTPQLVVLPGLAASAWGGQEPGHDVRPTARGLFPSMPVPRMTQRPIFGQQTEPDRRRRTGPPNTARSWGTDEAGRLLAALSPPCEQRVYHRDRRRPLHRGTCVTCRASCRRTCTPARTSGTSRTTPNGAASTPWTP
jgi:hypothetical protein